MASNPPFSSPGPESEGLPETGTALAPAPAAVPALSGPLPEAGAEVAMTAAGVQARVAIEARYVMAMRNPRDWDEVKERLIATCRRPGFADRARYKKPQGGKFLTGPSIRFAEEAVRCMRNIYVESAVIQDDDFRRIIRVTVTDLEANLSYPKDVTVEKTVERKNKGGREVLSQRQNTKLETVYRVRAEEDETLVKQDNLISKAMRNGVLRILPADIAEEAMAQVELTLKLAARDKDNIDRLAKAFEKLGVPRERLVAYLTHPLEEMTPEEYADLRAGGEAIKDGETTWEDFAARQRDARRSQARQPAKPVVPEVIHMADKPKGTGASMGEGYKLDPTPATPGQAANQPPPEENPPASAANIHVPQPGEPGFDRRILTNADLRQLYNEVNAKDLDAYMDKPDATADDGLRAMLGEIRGLKPEEVHTVFPASCTYGELERLRPLIASLPDIPESDGGT